MEDNRLQARMKTWQYMEVLRRSNKSWFISKDNTKEKINALAKVTNEGYPSLIYSLIEFLKDDSKEIREAVCKTISHLFNKIDSKKVYYDTLRHCNISKDDIDFYKANFAKEQYVTLLAISSFNSSGYIREKAVRELSQVNHSEAIRFLIYRLADWVLQVRQTALNGIANYKTPAYIDSLIENLPLFEWLKKVERANLDEIYRDMLEFISFENKAYIIDNFEKYPDKLRILLARHISLSLSGRTPELKLFLNDRHFLIRRLSIAYFNELEQTEIEKLLSDKSATIRFQTLYCLKDQPDFEKTAKRFLTDTSASIRQLARGALKHSGIDFAKFYNDNLQSNIHIIASLSGLAETDAKHYVQTVKFYLDNEKVKVRKTAFSALCKLDDESAYDFALENLDTPYTGLRKTILIFLSRIPWRQEVMEKARTLYATGDFSLKKSMLKLFDNVGGWTAIPDLMLASIDENEEIRWQAYWYLRTWRERAVRLFSTPRPEEIERAQQVFRIVNEVHKSKKYFKTNPVDGFDFYFR